ncbi:hypothetical protein XaC1_179 [Xanthomonas phage XaC1]|nr:hypothetical protein XaC1_179 [Xanthomonas phage XaC1]
MKNKILKLLRSTLKKNYKANYDEFEPAITVKKHGKCYLVRGKPNNLYIAYRKPKLLKLGPIKYQLRIIFDNNTISINAKHITITNSYKRIFHNSTISSEDVFNLSMRYNLEFDIDTITNVIKEISSNKKYHNKLIVIYIGKFGDELIPA